MCVGGRCRVQRLRLGDESRGGPGFGSPLAHVHCCLVWHLGGETRGTEGIGSDSAPCDAEEKGVRVALTNLTGSAFLRPSFYFFLPPHFYPGGSPQGCVRSLMGRRMSRSRAEGHPSVRQAANPNGSFWECFSSSQAHAAPA